jgi:hypothetical protein
MDSLPLHALLRIINHLDPRDQKSLAAVNRRMHVVHAISLSYPKFKNANHAHLDMVFLKVYKRVLDNIQGGIDYLIFERELIQEHVAQFSKSTRVPNVSANAIQVKEYISQKGEEYFLFQSVVETNKKIKAMEEQMRFMRNYPTAFFNHVSLLIKSGAITPSLTTEELESIEFQKCKQLCKRDAQLYAEAQQ